MAIDADATAAQAAESTGPVTVPARPAPRAHAQYRPAVMDYIAPELRRIGALGIISLALLVGLSILVL